MTGATHDHGHHNLERMHGVDWMRSALHGVDLVVPAITDALERLTGQPWTHTVAGLIAVNDHGGTCYRCQTRAPHWLVVAPGSTFTDFTAVCDTCDPPERTDVVSVPTMILRYWVDTWPELSAALAERRRGI